MKVSFWHHSTFHSSQLWVTGCHVCGKLSILGCVIWNLWTASLVKNKAIMALGGEGESDHTPRQSFHQPETSHLKKASALWGRVTESSSCSNRSLFSANSKRNWQPRFCVSRACVNHSFTHTAMKEGVDNYILSIVGVVIRPHPATKHYIFWLTEKFVVLIGR